MKKYLLTALIAAMSSMCFAQEEYGLKTFTFVDQGYSYMRGLAMSTDGRYISGAVGLSSEGSFIYDVETGDLYVHTAVNSEGSQARGVSDTGVAACYDLGPMTISITGEEVQLEGDDGSASFAAGITPDGTIVVGAVTNNDADDDEIQGMYGHACYWENGVQVLLPQPTAEDLEVEDMNGTQATHISADGSVILGYVYDRWSQWPCIAWVKGADGTYTCDPICKGYYQEDQWSQSEDDNPYYTFHPTGLSKNGTYIALNLGLSNGDNIDRIGRFNIETRDLEVAEIDSYGFTSSDVANDGSVLTESSNGNAYIWRPDTDEPKRLAATYPLATGLADFDLEGEHIPMAITPDGRYIMGFAWIYDETTEEGYYSFYRFDTVQYENSVGIVSITNDEDGTVNGIYSIDGRRLESLRPGINIIKKNGKTSKYLIR